MRRKEENGERREERRGEGERREERGERERRREGEKFLVIPSPLLKSYMTPAPHL